MRSQLHAASLQSRLHRVLAVNDALDRELRLAGGQRLLPGSAAPPTSAAAAAAAAAEDRMARSTPDLRPPSRIPQPVSLRRHQAGRGRSPTDRQQRSLHRPRSPGDRQQRSLQTAGRPRSRSRETQTYGDPLVVDAPRVVDRSVNAVESTACVVDSGTSIGICTASVGTCTSLLPQAAAAPAEGSTALTESQQGRRGSGIPHGSPVGPRGLRPPDRTRVSAILNETSPLKLQKELLTLLVEAEVGTPHWD